MWQNNFTQLAEIRIINIGIPQEIDNMIHVTLTTVQFERVETRPYVFDRSEWDVVRERGYV